MIPRADPRPVRGQDRRVASSPSSRHPDVPSARRPGRGLSAAATAPAVRGLGQPPGCPPRRGSSRRKARPGPAVWSSATTNPGARGPETTLNCATARNSGLRAPNGPGRFAPLSWPRPAWPPALTRDTRRTRQHATRARGCVQLPPRTAEPFSASDRHARKAARSVTDGRGGHSDSQVSPRAATQDDSAREVRRGLITLSMPPVPPGTRQVYAGRQARRPPVTTARRSARRPVPARPGRHRAPPGPAGRVIHRPDCRGEQSQAGAAAHLARPARSPRRTARLPGGSVR